MARADVPAREYDMRMKTTRERQIARLDNIYRRIEDLRTCPRQLSRAQLARWGRLIEERDRVQAALNRTDKNQ